MVRAPWDARGRALTGPSVAGIALLLVLCGSVTVRAQQPPSPQPEQRSPGLLPVPDLERLDDDRLAFSYPVAEASGGGTVSGRAGSLDFPTPRRVVLADEVELVYGRMRIRADRIEVDLEANTLQASGNIVVDEGPRRLTAETIEYDLGRETGTFYEATAYLDPDFYFRGRTVRKVSESAYVVRHGVFTSCSAEVPEWSFAVSRARVDVGGYARALHTALRVKKLPIFYLPFILWPVKDQRTSGFLIPDIGYSEHRGMELGLAYYQTFGDSFDATLHADLYEKIFFGTGVEFRYRPTPGTSGILSYSRVEADYVGEADDRSARRVTWVHDSHDLPGGLRSVVRVQDYSDFAFFAREFERRIDNLTRRDIYSSAFLTGSWGSHSLNVLFDQRERLRGSGLPEDSTVQRQLPEVEYRVRSRRLGRTPFYFSLSGSGHVIDVDPPQEAEGFRYQRTDWTPELSFPFSRLPWLSMTATVANRFTWYSESFDPVAGALTGDALERSIPRGGLEIVGPSLSRIYDVETRGFSRFKHIVEPQITYVYGSDFDEQDRVLQFDEVDRLGALNIVTVGVTHRLLGKPKPTAREREAFLQQQAAREREAADGDAAAGEEGVESGDQTSALTTAEDLEPSSKAALVVDDGPVTPDVIEQLQREDELASGMTAPRGALDALTGEAALLASMSPREILSLRIAQSRTFEESCPLETVVPCGRLPVPEGQVHEPGVNLWGPVVVGLRYNPTNRVSLDTRIDYSPLFGELQSISISSGMNFGRYAQNSVGLSWYRVLRENELEQEPDGDGNLHRYDLEEASNQVRLNAGFEIVPGRLRLGTQLNYNLLGFPVEGEIRYLQSQAYGLSYTGDCYAMDLSFVERQFQGAPIQEIRFALSLKNVGTLLDLKSGVGGNV